MAVGLPYRLHKNKCALRFKVIYPEFDKFIEGCVMAEMAEFKSEVNGNKTYDWENKISTKLSADDLGKMVYTLKTGLPASMYHEFNDIAKGISLGPSGEKWFFTVDQRSKTEDKSKNRKISMLLASHELTVLQVLFEAWIPLLF